MSLLSWLIVDAKKPSTREPIHLSLLLSSWTPPSSPPLCCHNQQLKLGVSMMSISPPSLSRSPPSSHPFAFVLQPSRLASSCHLLKDHPVLDLIDWKRGARPVSSILLIFWSGAFGSKSMPSPLQSDHFHPIVGSFSCRSSLA